jgi:hypothetical protein
MHRGIGGFTCFEMRKADRRRFLQLAITNAPMHDLEDHLVLFFHRLLAQLFYPPR